MVYVNPKIAGIVAHQPGMVAAVERARDRIADIAEGLFAQHDNPGGHEITRDDPADVKYGPIDAFVSLEGPDPLAVEFGHWATRDETGRFTTGGGEREFIEGLHILGRAVAQAEAEGRL